jgi:glycosyltransferase involved in cell wall biosynthesis
MTSHARLSADRRLRIGLLAPPWATVPPAGYGGTEAVVDQLAVGLDRAGHDVRLFTLKGSSCPVPKAGVIGSDDVTIIGTASIELHHMLSGYEWLTDQGCDVIHDHTLAGPLCGPVPAGMPVVTTNHGPFSNPELATIYRAVQTRAAIVAISHNQAHDAAGQSIDVAAVIHHGIDTDQIPVGRGDGGYLLFLGRMAPEKGAHRAIAAARSTGQRLVIAAKMREPAEVAYFRNHVSPHLGNDVQFVGEVAGADKWALLGGATALINPITWSEPFGLVMIEALATGTPVIAFPRGSAPELIDDGRTGFLVEGEAELAQAAAAAGELDRAMCRRAAVERFSRDVMVEAHLDLYRSLISRADRSDRADRTLVQGRALS